MTFIIIDDLMSEHDVLHQCDPKSMMVPNELRRLSCEAAAPFIFIGDGGSCTYMTGNCGGIVGFLRLLLFFFLMKEKARPSQVGFISGSPARN